MQIFKRFCLVWRPPSGGMPHFTHTPEGAYQKDSCHVQRSGGRSLGNAFYQYRAGKRPEETFHGSWEDQFLWLDRVHNVNGVRIFFEEMKHQKKDIRSLGSCRIASIGAGTKNALEERGLFCDLVPEHYDGVSLAGTLADRLTGTEHIRYRGQLREIRKWYGFFIKSPEFRQMI